ncbi:MAG: DoxX family protein, partial [Cyclobacteriaceae bacterium]|nr:DoxX family protein [Cyclobacteriaceae bacterium HetDA_MAG_MS6]
AVFWVYLTGVALILAAVAIVINKKAKLATMLLGIMLLLFAVLIHLPGMPDAMPSFFKDIALAGAAFYLSANSKD